MTLDKEIGVKVGVDQEIIVMTVHEAETGKETEMDGCNLDPELCQMSKGGSMSRSNSRANTNRDRSRCIGVPRSALTFQQMMKWVIMTQSKHPCRC